MCWNINLLLSPSMNKTAFDIFRPKSIKLTNIILWKEKATLLVSVLTFLCYNKIVIQWFLIFRDRSVKNNYVIKSYFINNKKFTIYDITSERNYIIKMARILHCIYLFSIFFFSFFFFFCCIHHFCFSLLALVCVTMNSLSCVYVYSAIHTSY